MEIVNLLNILSDDYGIHPFVISFMLAGVFIYLFYMTQLVRHTIWYKKHKKHKPTGNLNVKH